MFESLQENMLSALRTLRGRGKLTEANMREGLDLVQRALLEADVSVSVAKDFTARVGQQAVGEQVLKSLDPTQQLIGIVHQELGQPDGPGRSLAALAQRVDAVDALRPARLGQDHHLRQARPADPRAGQEAHAGGGRLATPGRHPTIASARPATRPAGVCRSGRQGPRGPVPGGSEAGQGRRH